MNNEESRNYLHHKYASFTKNIKERNKYSSSRSKTNINSLNTDSLFPGLSRQFKIINKCLNILKERKQRSPLNLPWIVSHSPNNEKLIKQKSRFTTGKEYSNNIYLKEFKRANYMQNKSEDYKSNYQTTELSKKSSFKKENKLRPNCIRMKLSHRSIRLNRKELRKVILCSVKPERHYNKKQKIEIKRNVILSHWNPIYKNDLKDSFSSGSSTNNVKPLKPKFDESLINVLSKSMNQY